MADHTAKIEKLMDEAEGLKDGPAKAAILEQAVAIADTHQDVKLGYAARKKLLPACLDSGQPDLMLVAYSWCLAQCDRDPSQFNLDDILWEYRWVVSEMTTFPTISRPQIEDALADITRRYQAAGDVRTALESLAKEGYAEAELDQIGDMDGAPDEEPHVSAYQGALEGEVSIVMVKDER